MLICRYRYFLGFTLLELALVVMVLLTIVGAFFGASQPINNWRQATEAGLTLREVEVAQRQFLADNPQKDITTITQDDVLPYLDSNITEFPTVEDLEGNTLEILVNQSPPILVKAGTTEPYDINGSTTDGLWDVGR